MISERMAGELKGFLRNEGAALVGVAPVERFRAAPPGHHPHDLLPEARSVVVFALPMLESTFRSPNPRVYVLRYHQLREMVQNIGYKACALLERWGHYAANLPGTAPLNLEEKILFADLSYRHAAVLAGLGEIGWNQLLVTPQYGPRVWLMAVVTSAELAPDAPFSGTTCLREGCNLCIEQCPTGALVPGQPTDTSKCTGRPAQYGLHQLVRHLKDIARETDPQRRERLLTGPTTWGIWMHLQYGGPPDRCHFCVSACPVGRIAA